MSNNLRTRNGMPFNFVNGLKVRGMDIESLIPGIEGIPEAGSKYQFAGDGTNKSFTLPVSPYNKDAVDVYVKQLYVHPDDYTLVGDTVTLVEAPPAVVAGETYNVVIKVSLTTLNGYVNANRVSFEGENLDDILEKGKPLANYSNLRAYAGAATQVRITAPGIAGFFYYDPLDTASADNGGTVIVSSNGKRWKRVFDGCIDPDFFEGTDLVKIQSAVLALNNVTRSISFTRMYNITGQGPIDLVSLRNGDLRLTYFIGKGGGIRKDDAGYVYTSSLANYGRYHDIVSKNMRYEGITGANACVFNCNQLVGIWSDHDNYFQIDQILEADTYLVQSFRLTKPDIQRGSGYALSARYYFDVVIDSPRFEARTGGFMRTVMGAFNTFTYDINNVRIINGCYESIGGTDPVFLLGAADGLLMKGNYFEYNGGQSISLTANTRAIAHVGVEVSNTTEWNSPENRDSFIPMISWGKFNIPVISSANTCRGLMHDLSTAGLGTVVSTGDYSFEGNLVISANRSRIEYADKALTRWDEWVPAIVWTTGTPLNISVKAKYKRSGKTCHFAIHVTSTNGNGCTRVTFSLPEPGLNDALLHTFSATRSVAGSFSPVPAYYISTGGTVTVRLEGAPATAGSAFELGISGTYELA